MTKHKIVMVAQTKFSAQKDVLRKRLFKVQTFATADSSIEYSSYSVSKHTHIVQTHTKERKVIEQFHVHLFAVEIQYVRNSPRIGSTLSAFPLHSTHRCAQTLTHVVYILLSMLQSSTNDCVQLQQPHTHSLCHIQQLTNTVRCRNDSINFQC